MQDLLPSLEEEWGRLPLERGMRDNLPRIGEISNFATPAIKAFLRRDTTSLPHLLGVSCERILGS